MSARGGEALLLADTAPTSPAEFVRRDDGPSAIGAGTAWTAGDGEHADAIRLRSHEWIRAFVSMTEAG